MYIDEKEALRYMGYRGQEISGSIRKLMGDCIGEVMEISKKSFTYELFDIERLGDALHLKGSTLVLRGEAIGAHLQKAEKCAVMAATIGLEIDRRIALYSKTDLTKSLVFDACATAAVEALCDTIQGELEAKAAAMGFQITPRYSPGYGDFSIEVQKEIIKVLKAYEKIGLSVNESSIMIPRKSVTAVIGMQYGKCDTRSHRCKACGDKHCTYRKDGADDEQRV